ncbi:hypothetical protein [Pseudomonas aeruginosa]|uniref:hypothetical protein n=1 Tax=Pseudomonadaceae TaxID=135621 RepID=UPI0029559606|nr:hypothetical protein [Pseudomonas aeruginosa]MDV7900296.1 hypothetical protein [Pseudomonas aeruginosa]
MVLQWIRKWISTAGAGAPSEEGVSRAGRFDLYVNGAARHPIARFASLKQAEVLAQRSFKDQHYRIVDTDTGGAAVFNYKNTALLPEPFLQGIDITGQVTPSPRFIRELHARKPMLTQPTFCWQNCLLTILSLQASHPQLRYALSLIHHPEAGVEGHALIEHAGQFHDPTLEHQSLLRPVVTYRLLEVLEPDQLIAQILARFGEDGLKEMRQGRREWSNFRVDASGSRIFDL